MTYNSTIEAKDLKRYIKKSQQALMKIAQRHFNEFIRNRDKLDQGVFRCISCDSLKDNMQISAGHYYSAGHHSAVRFDEDNVHGQSIQDNRFNEGNFEDYLINVRYRIGDDRLNALLKRAEISKQRVYKWTLEELSIIRNNYKQKTKELKTNVY